MLEGHEEKVAWKLQLQKDLAGKNLSNRGKRGIGEYLLGEHLLEGHWRLIGGGDGYFRPCIRHLSLQRRNEISLPLLPLVFGSADMIRYSEGVMERCMKGHGQE